MYSSTVVLACRTSSTQEHSYTHLAASEHNNMPDDLVESQTTLQQYFQHVEDYSERILSNGKDALAAFEDILGQLYGKRSEHLFGLPSIDFDRALLWEPSHRTESYQLVTSFPSWSWATQVCQGRSVRYHRSSDILSSPSKVHLTLTRWYAYKSSKVNLVCAVNEDQWSKRYQIVNTLILDILETPEHCAKIWLRKYYQIADILQDLR